jgi:hypothetical protein
MPQGKEKPPIDQSAPEATDPEIRATIEATQRALEQSAAEIERSKRLLGEAEELGSPGTPLPPSNSKGRGAKVRSSSTR